MTIEDAAVRGRREALWTLVFVGLGLAVWSGLLGILPERALLAESNYQANLIRLERAFFSETPGRSLLIGSSITGRLLPDYFSGTDLEGAVSLGLDGSGPTLAMELVEQLSVRPDVLLMEANLLPVPISHNDVQLRKSVAGFSFRLARYLPFMRAENRPSALLYSALKRRQDRRLAQVEAAAPAVGDGRSGGAGIPALKVPGPETFFHRIPLEERNRHRGWVRDQVTKLRGMGIAVILVRYPQSGSDPNPETRPADLADDLAKELGVPQIELGLEFQKRGLPLGFTDGTHLTAGSARAAAKILAELAPAVAKRGKGR